METVRVQYSGPKKDMTVCFPIPFLAKSEQDGDAVTFSRTNGAKVSYADVPAQYVDALCQPGGLFAKADEPPTADAQPDDDAKKQAARDRMAKAREAKTNKARDNGGAAS